MKKNSDLKILLNEFLKSFTKHNYAVTYINILMFIKHQIFVKFKSF